MNLQKPPKGIEWTRIVLADGTILPGYTSNPIRGCIHGCEWEMPDGSIAQCYAKTIAERFTRAYPQGFKHHYFVPAEMHNWFKLKQPAGIFVDSMSDLFSHAVPLVHLRKVLAGMAEAYWHTFIALTKYPPGILRYPLPHNLWVGVSTPATRGLSEEGALRALYAYLGTLANVDASVRLISAEPLSFDITPALRRHLNERGELPIDWMLVGAASNSTKHYQPEPAWVENLLRICDDHDIPVFFKGNLQWEDWRADFPPWMPIQQEDMCREMRA